MNGFFSTKSLGSYFRKAVLQSDFTDFESLPVDLFIVATYLNQPKKAVFSRFGKEDSHHFSTKKSVDYIDNVDVAEAITASAALPPIFTPVKTISLKPLAIISLACFRASSILMALERPLA